MAKAKKTWQEKLMQSENLPRVEEVTPQMSQKWGTGKFVIPAPVEVDAIMRQVPEGKVITTTEIRALLAQKHGANFA